MSLQLRCLHTHSLALVVTLLLLTATSGDSKVPKNITAVLGHSVTFTCPSTHSDPVEGLYIQKVIIDKDDLFINGFYKDHKMPVSPAYLRRTKVNKMELSVEMRNISVSDEGLYNCIFLNNPENTISAFLLKVTAEYSIPTVTTDCSEHKHGHGGAVKRCELSCLAEGGYPQSAVRWVELNPSLTSIINNWSSADNESKTWTINQTIMYNCDQPTNVSCAVGGAVSDTISICETESFPLVVITAIIIVLVFVLLLIFVVVMKCCCRRQEDRADGADEVGFPLADCHSQLKWV